MIGDLSRISLSDGTVKAAVECGPSLELLTYRAGEMKRGRLVSRWYAEGPLVKLILASGEEITGSADQPVGLADGKQQRWMQMGRVPIGTKLRGERAGMPVSVMVIGRVELRGGRLVGLETHNHVPFFANGVLCK